MATATRPNTTDESMADLLRKLGRISPSRVRMQPAPGTATEDDLLRILAREDRLYELVDGVLVEKAMGFQEALVATILSRILGNFIEAHQLGLVAGADALMRVRPGKLRMPDVSFLSWDHFPGRVVPDRAIAEMAPDLAVEVVSRGNTKAEIALKLREYFEGGTRLAWVIEPRKRSARVYTSPTDSTPVSAEGSLDGGDVVPGFSIPLGPLFENLPKA